MPIATVTASFLNTKMETYKKKAALTRIKNLIFNQLPTKEAFFYQKLMDARRQRF